MAVELETPVLQIVGFQNSGKTTLVTKIVHALMNENFRVGTLKHHGHGGFPDVFDKGKDSEKHRHAGAVVTGVEGDGVFQLHAHSPTGWSIDDMLSFYNKLSLDLIVVEGFKKANFPKIVLIRSEEDMILLNKLTQIVLVISWSKAVKSDAGIPCFNISAENDYIEWIVSNLKGRI
ncbi:molybdopterin-guanine dinucleotide biosynthesis protein B [Bacillus sp. Marseille-P3661]|uniref:molybdopterin-guanine dinucleotide biosynthesis protein B n=1 Tax=Bacillus sp. Marseille-P3661 TaxID=1936234 RepID=UPI002155AD50|nr:molybdopterin-guanine dinucleotide biosynthesis protein B [Bacillus sp. Marseille-P3661]